MNLVAVVRDVVAVEAIGALLIVAIVIGSGLRWKLDVRRRVLARDAVQRMVAAGIERQPYASEDLRTVQASRRSHVVAAIVEFSRSLGGSDRAVLAEVASQAGVLSSAERDLTARAWWRRLDAARLLTLLGASEAQILRMLRDPHPLVRAQGATAASAWPITGAPKHLVAMLRDDEEICRFSAKQAIIRLGTPALAVVLRELRDSDPRGPRPGPEELLDLASTMARPDMLDIALGYSHSPDAHVRQAAAGLLSAIGAEGAGNRLIEMLGDEASGVRCAAAHALGATGEWRAAPLLAARLDDDAYEVRIGAAMALQRLGAPGTLLLRRTLTAGTPRAAGVARQTLDVLERVAADVAS